MATFEDSLKHFDQLLDRTPVHLLEANRDFIKNIFKKLKKSEGSSASSLLEALESSREAIEDYTRQPIKQAVASPVSWADADLRVHDIRLGATRHDNLTKFRKGLGEISLALQYHEWEMQEFQYSRLGGLCSDPASFKNKVDGNIVKFITAHHLPKIDCVEKAIQHGTKLLLLENLVGTRGTSAVLFFAYGKIRAVKYSEIKGLVDSMRAKQWINELFRKVTPWFEDCWASYKDEVESRKRSRNGDDEHERLGKRRRADGHTLAQASDCAGEPGMTMPSQETPAINSGLAQVGGASADRGCNSSNAVEETANNRLQPLECTPSARGMPIPAPFSAPDLVASGQRVDNVPNLHTQWQPDAELIRRRQGTAAHTGFFRPLPTASNPMHAMLPEAGEPLPDVGTANYPASHAQTCSGTGEVYGDVSASDLSWNSISLGTENQFGDINLESWNLIYDPFGVS